MIVRGSAIEPTIGHMKADGKFERSWLKGAFGDAMHAVLSGVEQNLRFIINKLKSRSPGGLHVDCLNSAGPTMYARASF